MHLKMVLFLQLLGGCSRVLEDAKIRNRKSLAQERFKSNLEFRYQIIGVVYKI